MVPNKWCHPEVSGDHHEVWASWASPNWPWWQGQSLVGYGSLMFIAGRIFMVFSWDMDLWMDTLQEITSLMMKRWMPNYCQIGGWKGWSFPLPFCDAHTTEDRADHGIQTYIYIIIYCIHIIYISIRYVLVTWLLYFWVGDLTHWIVAQYKNA